MKTTKLKSNRRNRLKALLATIVLATSTFTSSVEASPDDGVNGANVTSFTARDDRDALWTFSQVGPNHGQWVARLGDQTVPFTVVRRQIWSLTLRDEIGGGLVRIDTFKRSVYFTPSGGEERFMGTAATQSAYRQTVPGPAPLNPASF